MQTTLRSPKREVRWAAPCSPSATVCVSDSSCGLEGSAGHAVVSTSSDASGHAFTDVLLA